MLHLTEAFTADAAKKIFHFYCVFHDILIYSNDTKASKKLLLDLSFILNIAIQREVP